MIPDPVYYPPLKMSPWQKVAHDLALSLVEILGGYEGSVDGLKESLCDPETGAFQKKEAALMVARMEAKINFADAAIEQYRAAVQESYTRDASTADAENG